MLMPPIETARLLIRPFQDDDLAQVCTYSTDPSVMAYMGEGVQSVAQTQEFIQQNQLADEVTAYAMVLRTANNLIGHMVFHPWFAPRTYEIGWVLQPAYQRQGYTTEAARALLRYGFETLALHRVIATCQPENVASHRVMEKLGMRREGHFQQCIYRGSDQGVDKWWDEYFYAMLAREWFAAAT